MSRLFVESDAAEAGPFTFSGDSGELLALLSFGIAEPHGSQHALTEFVRALQRDHGVDVTALLTFYDRDVEDAIDEANLEAAWQDAAALHDCLVAVHEALSANARLRGYLTPFPSIPRGLEELQAMAAWAAQREARIRISFSLS